MSRLKKVDTLSLSKGRLRNILRKHVALFGGSFNPPHWAHRQVADYLLGLSQFDEVWILPTYDHPFDKDLAPYAHREKMCQLTVLGLGPKVLVCGVEGEIKRSPSYTIDTVLELKSRHPGYRFTLVVGSDCKKELGRWKEIDALKREAEFFFVPRPGLEESPFMNTSSSEIRELIRGGKKVTKYLVPEVAKFIDEKGFYRK